jgi:hypothetical protein
MSQFEKFVEIRKITKYKDGCVYETAHVRYEWVDLDTPMYSINDKDEQVCAVSLSKHPHVSSPRRKLTK